MVVILGDDSFKSHLITILQKHFADPIVKKFRFDYEMHMYANSLSGFRQKKEGKHVVEVRYQTDNGTWEYICDVASWWGTPQLEYALLKHITDKYKAGKIRFDTNDEHISKDVHSGKFETPDEELLKGVKH